MRVLIDTNVILDVLFARMPFLPDSITVLHMCEDGFAEGMVTTKTLADIYYFLRKQLHDEGKAREAIRTILQMVTVCDVTDANIREALATKNNDFEDAIAASCARHANCQLVITRNKRHFEGMGIKCRTPEEFVI